MLNALGAAVLLAFPPIRVNLELVCIGSLANAHNEEGPLPRTASPIYNAAVATASAESAADPAPGANKSATPTPTPTSNDEPRDNAPVRCKPCRLRKRSATSVLVALPAHPPRAESAQNASNRRPATCPTLVSGKISPCAGYVHFPDSRSTMRPLFVPRPPPAASQPVHRESRPLCDRSTAPILVALPAHPLRAESPQNNPNRRPDEGSAPRLHFWTKHYPASPTARGTPPVVPAVLISLTPVRLCARTTPRRRKRLLLVSQSAPLLPGAVPYILPPPGRTPLVLGREPPAPPTFGFGYAGGPS
ncbi:hypothetical protein FRC09_016583 [Ceratobasidium sp. 395]|nr:hypothetical protein FRC09_016583 [Ceratobasidium sp. 395]